MSNLSLRPALRRFIELVGLDRLVPQQDLDSGLAELEADLLRVALDVHVAETRGLPLSTACRDDVSFPHLFRLHAMIRDVLTMELPTELVEWVRRLLAHPDHLAGDEIQIALGQAAISSERLPLVRALARLLLFESLRASLLLLDHVPQPSAKLLPARALDPNHEAPGFAAAGIDDAEIDRLADREVTWWLSKAADFEGDVRPITVLLTTALIEVQRHVESIQMILARANRDVAENLEQRDELERRLKRMNTPDALLIRNIAAPRLEEQRLTIERLREQHPVAFGDRERNALDQQMYRLATNIKNGQWPERKAPALVDLIAEQIAKESA